MDVHPPKNGINRFLTHPPQMETNPPQKKNLNGTIQIKYDSV